MQKFEVDGRTFTYGQRTVVHGKTVTLVGPCIEFDNMVSYYRLDVLGNYAPGFPLAASAREVMPYNGGSCVDNSKQCNHPFLGRHQIMTGFGHFLKVGEQEHYCQYPRTCI